MQYQLRSYQSAAVDAGVAYLTDEQLKGRHGIIVQPTGAGKSLVIANLVARLPGPCVVLQPSKEILAQNAGKLASYGHHAAVFSAAFGRREIGQVTLATIGSVVRYAEAFREFPFVLVDECHTGTSAKGGQIVEFLSVLANARICGLTATPFRLASNSLGSELRFLTRTRPRIFRDVVHVTQIEELRRGGYWAPLDYRARVKVQREKLQLNSTGADYTDASVQRHFAEVGFVGALVDEVRALLAEGRKHILVFTRFVNESERLAQALPCVGVVTAETPPSVRDQVVREFRAGRLRVVTNVGCLALGFDFPALDAVVLGRPSISLSVFYQQCLDSETEVLTMRGWLGRTRISELDRVAAMNDTGEVWWQPIQRIVERKVGTEQMFALDAPHLNLRVTAGHQLLVRARGMKRWQKQDASVVASRRAMFTVPVSGVQQASGAPLSDDELRVLGWFLTDGNINKTTNALTISQSAGKPRHCAAIRAALRGAGLKFGEGRYPRTGEMAGYADNVMFTVSKGAPRGTGKDLRGWVHLSAWLDKTIPAIYESLTSNQLAVLLDAMNLGDGANDRKTIAWTQRTMSIACGTNETLADRVQSLCVRRGFRCHKSPYVPKKRPSVTWWTLHIRFGSVSTVAGAGVKDGAVNGRTYVRSRLKPVPSEPDEMVWCVTNPVGTLIVRRHGKVTVVGNCGRAVRPHPSKANAAIVDMVGLVPQFGRVEDLVVRPTGPKGEQWVVTSQGRALTNCYFAQRDGIDPATITKGQQRRQYWARRKRSA